jgi:hypothetical protein
LWNENLIESKKISYASDLISEQGGILTYYKAITYDQNSSSEHLGSPKLKTEYTIIVLAMKQFHTRVSRQKSIHDIDPGISLTVLLGDERITIIDPNSKSIREMGIVSPELEFLAIAQLLNWSNEIERIKSEQVWTCVFTNLLYKLSNHFKLIQHQYKMFMMIAT